MAKKVSVLVGSLRRGSSACKVAQNVIPVFPAGYEIQIVGIGHLPLYNFDYDDPNETDFLTPESYTPFRGTIEASDSILFVTPENNRIVPACLKNVVDIGSKPNADAIWKKTPAGIISHPIGKTGGYSSQKNLRLALSYFDTPLTDQPGVFLGDSPILFDDSGKLIESVRDFVQGYIDQLVALVEKNSK